MREKEEKKLEELLEEILRESESKEELLDARVQQLWKRVDGTLSRQEERRQEQRRRKLRRWVSWTAAAAAVVVLAFVGLQQILQREALPGMDVDHAKQLLLSHQGDTGDQILLITGEDSINVEGDFAEIEHRGGEPININQEMVEKKKGGTGKEGTGKGATDATAAEQAEQIELLRLIVPKGKRSFVKLSDGSTLWVNSGSRLVYPAEFTGRKREIYLDGEIYGAIATVPGKSFSVHTERMEVTVLGTELNVQAYSSDASDAVVLVTGSVEVKPDNAGEAGARLLTPGKMAVVEEETILVSTVNVEDYTSWKEGHYRFKNEPLANVTKRLSRYYGVDIECSSEAGLLKCSGGIFLQDDLRDVLDGLAISLPITIEKRDNSYYIYTKMN